MRPKALLPLVLLALTAAGVSAQTFEDSVMMRKNSLCTAVLYSNDRWESYWEGPLKRENGNIGRITTQSVSGMVDYGVPTGSASSPVCRTCGPGPARASSMA